MAVTLRGLSGTSSGVTGSLGAETAPSPWPFAAWTVNRYGRPLVSPLSVNVVTSPATVVSTGASGNVWPGERNSRIR